jgi:intracellular sulfur oxidation DsrE/DsrF family protein
MHIRSGMSVWFVTVLVLALPGMSWSQDTSDEKPFADVHVVLQLSDQEKEAVVLDVANNLIKYYGGPDFVDIEIVTFGAGVRLLFEDGKYQSRIASLVDNGIRFYICENTLDTMERKTGVRPKVNPVALPVQAGVAKLVDSVTEGFILVKP